MNTVQDLADSQELHIVVRKSTFQYSELMVTLDIKLLHILL